jgi:hypothetical protein
MLTQVFEMTEMKTKAQKIWDTYCEGYSEALMTPVERFDTYLDKDSRKIIASVLREVINQLQVSPGIIKCPDIIELCEELKKL